MNRKLSLKGYFILESEVLWNETKIQSLPSYTKMNYKNSDLSNECDECATWSIRDH